MVKREARQWDLCQVSLIPALAVHLTILLIYFLGRRSVGEPAALWGAVLLTVSPGFMGMGRLLILDGLLTLLVTAGILCIYEAIRGEKFHRGWWILSALACGLGILDKGPIALLLVLPPVWIYRWLNPTPISIGWKNWVLFVGCCLAINLPWYWAIYQQQPLFLKYFLWNHNILRFLHPFDHLQPIWYYLPIFLIGMIPGSFLLYPYAHFLLSCQEADIRKRTAALGFWLITGSWCLLFFSLSGSKLPTYILSAFPCFALTFGTFLAQSSKRCKVYARVGIGLTMLGMCGLCYFGLPWYAQQRSPMAEAQMVSHYCADKKTPLVCFPRHCDSVSFYLGRNDLLNIRSKESQKLVEDLLTRPRTVVLFTHRHSLATLREVLPPRLRIADVRTFQRGKNRLSLTDLLAGDSPWGLCDLAVIERVP